MKFFRRNRNKKHSQQPAPSTGMNVFLRALDGSVVSCLLADEGRTRVSALKQQLEKTQKLPAHAVRLMYGGRCLCDSESLNDYGIEKDSILTVCLRLPGGSAGGVNFKFAAMETGRKQGSSNNAPSYRNIYPGFNLEGQCYNPGCIAYKDYVWCRLGYSTENTDSASNEGEGFNIGRLINEVHCPACRDRLNVDSIVSCGFCRCHYSYDGYENGVRFEGRGVVDYDDGFEYHGGLKDGKTWSWLSISVRPLKKTKSKKQS